MRKKSLASLVMAIVISSVILALPVFADDYKTDPISAYLNGINSMAGTVHTNNIMDVVTSSSDGICNLRSGPGLSYQVLQPISNGNTLYITAVYQDPSSGLVWGQTSYNGYSGWLVLSNTTVISVENSSRAEYDVTVTEPNYIFMRKGPGTEYDGIYQPAKGEVLRIYQTIANSFDGRPWGLTYVNGTPGWVSLNWTYRNNSWTYNQAQDIVFYNNVYYALVSSSDGFLNFRTGPSINSPIIQPIYNGTNLTVTAATDNSSDGLVWGLTTYNGYTGWVSMIPTTVTGIQNASMAGYNVTVQTAENLKLYCGPGTEYDILASNFTNGTTLYITQTVINSFDGRPWGRTTYGGMSGWISLNWTYRAPGN